MHSKEEHMKNWIPIAGAVALNIPTLVAVAYIPTLATAVMAVCLAALGAGLALVTNWAILSAETHGIRPAERYEHAYYFEAA
jgi:predicted phage tail protein